MFFLCEQLHTLIPFVIIKLAQKNTMLYQLCFDIFWFIQLKTFSEQKSSSNAVGWVILEWFYALCPFDLWKRRVHIGHFTARRDWIKLLFLQIVLREWSFWVEEGRKKKYELWSFGNWGKLIKKKSFYLFLFDKSQKSLFEAGSGAAKSEHSLKIRERWRRDLPTYANQSNCIQYSAIVSTLKR